MTKEVITVDPDMSVESAIEIMLEKDLSRLPVVDAGSKLAGIISKTDLVASYFERGDTSELEPPPRLPLRRGISYAETGWHVHRPEALISEVMKPATATVNETESIAKAAQLMAVHHLHGLPVISSTGELRGMLSPLDIVGWVAGLP